MKRFRTYLTELFSTPMNPTPSPKGTWTRYYSTKYMSDLLYKFSLAWIKGQYLLAPYGEEELIKFYAKNGMEIDLERSDGLEYIYLKGDKDTVSTKDPMSSGLEGLTYLVGFARLEYRRDQYDNFFKDLERMSPELSADELRDTIGNSWEIWFSASESAAGWDTGKIKSNPKKGFFWKCMSDDCVGVDDDMKAMSGSSAVTVFNMVMTISKYFMEKSKPKIVILGSKREAKNARNSIYRRLVKQMASAAGAKVYELDKVGIPSRSHMVNSIVVYFGKKNLFTSK
jgi:hypothetical protein